MSEPITQPYIDVGWQLKAWIKAEVQNYINSLPPVIPCQVNSYNGSTVNVTPSLNLNISSLSLQNIPVMKTRYLNLPLKQGDQGLLVASSYIYDDLVVSGQTYISSPKKSLSLSGYIFIPFTAISGDYQSAGQTNTTMYSQDGSSHVAVKNGDIELMSDEAISFNKLKTFLDNWQTAYNQNVTKINANNAIIVSAFAGLGVTITLQSAAQFTETYR